MTPADWQSAADPAPLLAFAYPGASGRKLRLFALACCRAAIELVPEGVRRGAIEVAERHADGEATDAELGAVAAMLHRLKHRRDQVGWALYEAVRYRREYRYTSAGRVARRLAEEVAYVAVPTPAPDYHSVVSERVSIAMVMSPEGEWVVVPGPDPPEEVGAEPAPEVPSPDDIRAARDGAEAAHRRHQADLARDILAGPDAPSAADFAAWLNPTTVGLAESIYRSRRTDDLPMLADALEESGCADATVLGHCRGGGVHARGCWLLDRLTGRG